MSVPTQRWTVRMPRGRGARHTLTSRHAGGAVAVTLAGTLALGALGVGSSDAAETVNVSAGVAAAAAAQQRDVTMSEIAMEAVRADALASRSAQREDARRKAAAAAKAKAKKAAAAKKAKALAAAQKDPQSVVKSLLDDYGFGVDQWQCLQQLWTGESAWNYQAANASSGAYGIPQSLPGSKMASAGADWKTNPVTQIRWGLGYIKDAYGSPCSAWNTWNSRYPHWY